MNSSNIDQSLGQAKRDFLVASASDARLTRAGSSQPPAVAHALAVARVVERVREAVMLASADPRTPFPVRGSIEFALLATLDALIAARRVTEPAP